MMILLKWHVPVAEPGVMGFLEFPVPTRVSQFDVQRPRAVRFAGGSTMPVASGAPVPTPVTKLPTAGAIAFRSFLSERGSVAPIRREQHEIPINTVGAGREVPARSRRTSGSALFSCRPKRAPVSRWRLQVGRFSGRLAEPGGFWCACCAASSDCGRQRSGPSRGLPAPTRSARRVRLFRISGRAKSAGLELSSGPATADAQAR